MAAVVNFKQYRQLAALIDERLTELDWGYWQIQSIDEDIKSKIINHVSKNIDPALKLEIFNAHHASIKRRDLISLAIAMLYPYLQPSWDIYKGDKLINWKCNDEKHIRNFRTDCLYNLSHKHGVKCIHYELIKLRLEMADTLLPAELKKIDKDINALDYRIIRKITYKICEFIKLEENKGAEYFYEFAKNMGIIINGLEYLERILQTNNTPYLYRSSQLL